MTTLNPSLFIALPSLQERGIVWTSDDIEGVLYKYNFGEISQIILYKNKRYQEFAIIHFERWFHGADTDAAKIISGGSIRVHARYGKCFRLVMYKPDARVCDKKSGDPTTHEWRRTANNKKEPVPDITNEPMPDLTEIYAFIDATANAVKDHQSECDREVEEGEIIE